MSIDDVTSDDDDAAAAAATRHPEDQVPAQDAGNGDVAFEPAELLDPAIGRQRDAMELDLSELDFMKPDGLATRHRAEQRLADLGVSLTVHLPTPLVTRLLDLIEMATTSRALDQGEVRGGHSEAAPLLASPPRKDLARRDGTMPDLRKITSMPTDPDVIDGVLRLVVELARAVVQGADGVSVSLLRHGRLSTVAASDQTIMDMDAEQYTTGEGPCVDASRQGRPFHAAVLAGETRWPAFTPQALGLGINAILSSPLKAFDQPVGALNIYSRTPLAFDATDQATAAAFAQKASAILSEAGVGITDDQLAQRYQEALRSRRDITLATGVIMEREGMDEDQAFSALLRLSLYHGETLRTRAEIMVRSSRQPEIGWRSGADD